MERGIAPARIGMGGCIAARDDGYTGKKRRERKRAGKELRTRHGPLLLIWGGLQPRRRPFPFGHTRATPGSTFSCFPYERAKRGRSRTALRHACRRDFSPGEIPA